MIARFAIASCTLFFLVAELPAQPPGKLRTDLYGDPLPDGAIARLGTTRWRHGSLVRFVVFSPNGSTVAYGGSGGLDNTVRLADLKTGRALWTFEPKPTEEPAGAAFSKDGRVLTVCTMAGGTGAITAMETDTGKQFRRALTSVPLTEMAFGLDGKTIAMAGRDTVIRLWNVSKGQQVARLDLARWIPFCLAFSPDGRTLACFCRDPWGDGAILLVETASGQLRLIIPWEWKGGCFQMAFSPDGSLLAGIRGWEGHVQLWNPLTGQKLGFLPSGSDGQRGLTFSPDGKMLGVFGPGSQEGLVLWEVASRKPIRQLNGHGLVHQVNTIGPLSATAGGFSPVFGGQPQLLASGGADATLRIWGSATGQQLNPDNNHGGPVDEIAYLKDGKVLTVCSADRKYRIFDAATGKELSQKGLGETSVHRTVLSPDGRMLAITVKGKESQSARRSENSFIVDTSNGTIVKSFEGNASIVPLAFQASGVLVSVNQSQNKSSWDSRQFKPLHSSTLESWETVPAKLAHVTKVDERINWFPFGWVGALAPDGTSLAIPEQPSHLSSTLGPFQLRAFDLATGQVRWVANNSQPDSLAYSPDGKILAEGRRSTINIRDAATGKILSTMHCEVAGDRLPDFPKHPRRLAFSPDGKTLIAGNGGRWVFIWDVATGKELQRFQAHRGQVLCVSVAPDGKTFATGSADTTALIWPMPQR